MVSSSSPWLLELSRPIIRIASRRLGCAGSKHSGFNTLRMRHVEVRQC
jgi:hypothetical protein